VDHTASASLALAQADPDLPRLAIKHDALFLLTDTKGLMPGDVCAGFGLFRDDTRWLSQWEVRVNGQPLMLLNAHTADGFAAKFVYGNQASRYLPKMSIMVERDVVLNEGLTERIVVRNFTGSLARVTLTVEFANDFADMFEVRGDKRKKRGQHMIPQAALCRRRVALAYKGLDGLLRETFIDFLKTRPKALSGRQATYELYMDPGTERELLFHIRTRLDGANQPPLAPPTVSFDQEHMIACARYLGWQEHNARVSTGNDQFNAVLSQSVKDIYTLRQTLDGGTALAAGVPWFVAPFGRDDFITALQTVAFMPDLTREILRFFAGWQGTKHDEELAEAPGKMPHEIRVGEMAKMKEIAFRPYYGTVDATQLWLMLLREYVRWTGDLQLVRELWDNVEAADEFLSQATNNGHQFITYGGKGALSNQGWKDSGNCIR
jgi:glycogen debranching enzyme